MAWKVKDGIGEGIFLCSSEGSIRTMCMLLDNIILYENVADK
jgi:hypothetical protein